MRKFQVGDKVQVNASYSIFIGREGVITRDSFGEGDAYTVALENDTIPERGFYEHELDKVGVDNREKLIVLAESLNNARLQANAIEIYTIESQLGVYGDISRALTDTLEVIVDDEDGDSADIAGKIYQSLLDGNTVREALKAVLG